VEYVRHVRRIGLLARRRGLDVLILLVSLWGALEVAFRSDPSEPRSTAWFAVPAAAVLPLPLLARRRFPFAAPALVWFLGAAISFIDGRVVVFSSSSSVAGATASYLLGNRRDATQAKIGLGIALSGAATVVYNDPNHATGELVFVPLLFAIAWLAGFALRERAEQAEIAELRAIQAERERDAATRIAVAEERARIARELHDIVAHAMSVMVLQVGAIRHSLPESLAGDGDALRGVEETGRTALAEMRRLLGAIRSDGEQPGLSPQPGLDRLDGLVDEVRHAGLPVDLHVEGTRVPLPRAIDLSAYRIVQEGLTNVRKHAQARKADVTLRYEPDGLRIEIRDDGRGADESGSPGYGLIGIRERVKIYGGEMATGTASGGGFVLTTRLPLGGTVS
jgi:signal transduction histidine kinase